MAALTPLDALIAAIDEDPDDDARYLVLADALIAAGDSRGELIVLQDQLARRPHDSALVRAEAAALRSAWGELAPLRRYFYASAWRLGFLDAVELHAHTPRDGVATLCRAAASRWLRTLRFRSTWRHTPADLAGFVNLRTLVVAAAGHLSDADVHALAALPRLVDLEVSGPTLSTAGIASTPGALRSLHLAYMKEFSDEHIAATAHIPTLRDLTIRNTFTFSDAAFARLGDSVRALSVRRCKTTSAIFQHLATQRLAELEINPDSAIDGAELARFEGGTLERLVLRGLANPEPTLAAVAGHRALRATELACGFNEHQPVRAETLGRVLALPELRRFGLLCAGIEGELAIDTRVTAIDLHVGGISRELAAAIASLPLTELRLLRWQQYNAWVDDGYVAQLATNPQLEELDLSQTDITDVGLRALSGHARLAKLAVSHCSHITSRGIADVVAALPALRELDVSITSIDASGLAAAASRPDLRALNLRGTTITDADLAALLPAAPTLRRLDLTSCKITLAAVPVLAQLQALEQLRIALEHALAEALRPLLPGCFVDV